MRGSIIKRGSRYSVVVELDRDPLTGRRRREWHSGYRTKRDAETARVEILGRLQRGEYVAPSKLTVAQYLTDEWLPAIRASLRPSTYESYAMITRERIVPAIGSARVQGLTAPMLNRLYGELSRTRKGKDGEDRRPLSPRSIRYTHAVLRHALADAVKWNRVVRNIADTAEPPSAKAARAPEMSTWTAEELRSFLDHVAEDRLYAAYRLAAMTGLRRGELLGLRWRDVDLDGGRLAIVQTLIGKREFSQPKTDRGRRNVELDSGTVAMLREHRKIQLEERLAWGPAYESKHDLVFSREDGSPTWPQSLSRAFERHAEDAGMPVIRFHDLRHTHATLALSAGVHPKVVSERLGHASVAITMDTYSHTIPAMQADAAAKVAALIQG
jgi:integrase